MSGNQRKRSKEYERKKEDEDIEQEGLNWHIWALTAIGFFTNSYSLFSMRVILPLIAFSNWKSGDIRRNEITVNIAILAGSIIGQTLCGYLADRYGRLKLYGHHFIALTYVTVCFAQSSSGFGSMSMIALLVIWGFFAGVSNGAGQPLAATITAEFAPVQSRARMMAAVFLMQPLGQLVVSAMSLLSLVIFGKSYGLAKERDLAVDLVAVDKMWRLVIVVNAVPAFITFVLRFTSPESPQYILEVDDTYSPRSNMYEAQSTAAIDADCRKVEDTLPRFEVGISEKISTGGSDKRTLDGLEIIHLQHEPKPKQLSYNSIKEYFWARGNWRRLAGTSMCWFLSGIVYSGLGMSNPRILAQIWTPSPLAISRKSFSSQVNPAYLNNAMYEALMQDSIHMITTISVYLLGSIILVAIIDYVPRKKMLVWSFVSLAVLFAIAGGCLSSASPVDLQHLEIMLYISCQILYSLGPNALLFIISTEIFPTCYRTSCHGISAVFGTFGSLLVTSCIGSDDPNAVGLRWVLIISSILMASAAAFAWGWIPEVQDLRRVGMGRKVPNKSLEALGTGISGIKAEEI